MRNLHNKSFLIFSKYLPHLKKCFLVKNSRHLHQTTCRHRGFFESNRRGVLSTNFPEKPWQEHIKDGRKIFIGECKLFAEEVREHFLQDTKKYSNGDTDVFFRFDNQECLKKWRVGSDKMNNEGFSDCKFEINDKGKGVFYGTIDLTPPKDGKNRFAGYCGIKSLRKQKSFFREDSYDWLAFTHLELRVKGDGRNYAVNLGLNRYFDVNWFDTYTYPLFTRGGPYWQTIRIPFSKFFLQAKGVIQDKQQPIALNKVNTVGITAAAVNGPFRLEIDYIGCHVDLSHKERFAYELYSIPREYVSD